MVKIEFEKRDFFWVGLIIILAFAGFGYAYNSGTTPDVIGHSPEELEVVWGNIINRPAGLDDGDDVGVSSPQTLSASSKTVTISGGNTVTLVCPCGACGDTKDVFIRSWEGGCSVESEWMPQICTMGGWANSGETYITGNDCW